jgi:hypothetical protein
VIEYRIEQRARKLAATPIRCFLDGGQAATAKRTLLNAIKAHFIAQTVSDFHLSRDSGNAKVFG